jgi:hypothetical protein
LYDKFFHPGESVAARPYEPQMPDIAINSGKLAERLLDTKEL